MHDIRKLSVPGKVKNEQETAAEYLESMVMMPMILEQIREELSIIRDSMGVIALYMEKKGLAEGYLKESDLLTKEEEDAEILEN